jgi:hypothetical protein
MVTGPNHLTIVLGPYLKANDVLWYAGNASSIAMIRKIPGLAPYATDQVDKLDVNSQERRLIQAVVAKTGQGLARFLNIPFNAF